MKPYFIRNLLKRLFFLWIFPALVLASPPSLTPQYVRSQIQGILESHVSYKKITPELVKRIFENFLHEMDPHKTYLLKSEVQDWTDPSDQLIHCCIQDLEKGSYKIFESMHQTMLQAIERRNQLSSKINTKQTLGEINPSTFKDFEWILSKDSLLDRLCFVHTYLMNQVALKLNDETKDKFFQRIEKRRLRQEKELKGKDSQERLQIVLSLLLKALTGALDAHSSYFTPKEATQFMIQVQSKLYGIGAQLKDDLDGLTIVRIMENGPAFKSNQIKINDRIIAVDGDPIAGLDIVESVEKIRGEKGTPVSLTLLRETGEGSNKHTEKLEVLLKRDEVILEEGRFETNIEPFGDGVIAHIRLFSFYQDQNTSCSEDLKKAIASLKKEHNLKAILLDLRGNAGGLLPQAVNVAGLFIKKGIVVSIKNSQGKIRHLRNTNSHITWDGPLVVLTDQFSASAAEIVAQSLQDYGRALLVGDPQTFGKGTFQIFTLDHQAEGKVNPKGEFKITQGKYYTVSGKSPQFDGVKIDIPIQGICSSLKVGEKHHKFPLKNDQINENFEDDLSDIPHVHRQQISRLYRFDLQKKLKYLQKILPKLKKNSELRLENNKNYQKFLEEIKKENFETDEVTAFSLLDFQLIEAMKVTKDFLCLKEKTAS